MQLLTLVAGYTIGGVNLEQERDLVERAKYSREAFGELYDAHYGQIYGYALRRTADAEAARDIAANVFYEALANGDTVQMRVLKQQLEQAHTQLKLLDGQLGRSRLTAPFDAIVVTAAPPRVPQPLLDQLKVGGHLVAPVGRTFQDLQVFTRTETGFEKRNVIPVRFVPMTGEAQKK